MTNEDITRRRVLQTLGATGVVGIAGCTDDGSDQPTTTGTNAQTDETTSTDGTEAARDGSGVTVALSTDPTVGTWDVYGGVSPYYTNIVEPLVWVSNEMELEPWLATEWEATGETTWEFTLRDGVTFHNGDPLTAEAVVHSFEQILAAWSWAPGWIHVESGGIEALDERTVEFTTTDPFPTYPGTIAHNMVAIQHPDTDPESGTVIGTGPFQVEEIQEEQRITTSAFDDYWNESPNVSELTFRAITDPNTRALSLEANEIDIAYQPPRSKISSLENSDATNVDVRGSPGAGYVGLNIHRSPTDDVDLRRALNYAVGQAPIVDSVLSGVGQPARGSIAPSIYWSAHDDLPEYGPDQEQASSLLEESSYDGEELKLLVSTELTDGELLAQAVAQQVEEIGASVGIQVMEDAAYDDAVRNGEGHLVLTESGTNSGAADYIIYETYHSEGDVNERLHGEEGTGLYNLGEEVDELLEEGFQTGDPDVKTEVYGEVQQRVADQAVIIPLYYSEYVVASSAAVENIDLRPIPEMVRWTGLTRTN